MREQGLSLEKYASRNVKVLVVANPANTNMLVLLKTVLTIPKRNFSCLTRLDEERLRYFVADKINKDLSVGSEGGREGSVRRVVRAVDVKDVFIFGNHSTTQVAINHNYSQLFSIVYYCFRLYPSCLSISFSPSILVSPSLFVPLFPVILPSHHPHATT